MATQATNQLSLRVSLLFERIGNEQIIDNRSIIWERISPIYKGHMLQWNTNPMVRTP